MGHVATLEPSGTGRRVWSHETHGNIRALPHRVAGPVAHGDARALLHREADLLLWDSWQHQSPSLSGDVPSATGHMAMPELSDTRSGSGVTRTGGDTGALPC
jgi:hypothetical protein